MEEKISPSKIWFIIPIFIFIFIAILVIHFMFAIVEELNGPKTYITLPSETIIEIDEEGKYGIYYEYTASDQLNEDIVFYFENTETGEVFENEHTNSYANYEINGSHGQLISQVVLPYEGEYSVTSSYTNEEIELKFQIGQNIVTGPLIASFSIVLVSIFGFFSIGISIAVIVILRNNSKEKLRKKLEQEKILKQN